MKIGLLGYGKMGKAIEEIALERGHSIPLKVNSSNIGDITASNLQECDAIIEFSTPENAVNNIQSCFKANVPVAVGTTGWYEHYTEIADLCEKEGCTLLTASNFSVGVNIFFSINERLAELMGNHEDYHAEIQEIHHTEKLDSPSGTAITIADQLIEHSNMYTKWTNTPSEEKSELEIVSYREPKVPGTHEVTYDSNIDRISIKHEAKSRKGFALGAVLAAEYIFNKKGIFTMKDVLTK